MKKRIWSFVALTINIVGIFNVSAQDANYWSHQYGAYSILLGGTVIGSVSDLASTYYNPGRLIVSDTSAFLITANAYQLSNLRIENGAGQGRDIRNSQIDVAPNLVAGNLPWRNFIRPSRMAYSVVQRYRNEFELIGRNAITRDVLPGIGGEEFLAGEVTYNFKISDLWVGITWSTQLSDKLSFGVTPYFSIRSMRWDRRILYEGIQENGNTAAAFEFNNFKYSLISLLGKFGLSYELGERSSIGLNLTTPYLNLFGNGEVLFNEAIVGGDLTGNGASDDKLVADQQLKRKANYRSGWAIGLGGSFPISPSGRLHLSAEYFTPVATFNLLDTTPFTGQTTGETLEHSVQTAAEGVINYGAGVEFAGSRRADFYASITTDTSPIPDDPDESITARLGIDMIHVSGGTVLSFGKVDLNLGLVYSFGNTEVPQFTNIYLPPGWSVGDVDDIGQLRSSRIKLVFGITVN